MSIANSHGAHFRLGLHSSQQEKMLLAGPSNLGLADPGHSKAICFADNDYSWQRFRLCCGYEDSGGVDGRSWRGFPQSTSRIGSLVGRCMSLTLIRPGTASILVIAARRFSDGLREHQKSVRSEARWGLGHVTWRLTRPYNRDLPPKSLQYSTAPATTSPQVTLMVPGTASRCISFGAETDTQVRGTSRNV